MTAVEDKTLGLLGLARRAGRLAVGEQSVAEACQSGRALAVLLARDAGDTTARRGEKLARQGAVPLVPTPYSKGELGWSIGRSSCALLAVTEPELAAALVEKLAGQDGRLFQLAMELRQRADARQRARAGKSKQPRERQRPADQEVEP